MRRKINRNKNAITGILASQIVIGVIAVTLMMVVGFLVVPTSNFESGTYVKFEWDTIPHEDIDEGLSDDFYNKYFHVDETDKQWNTRTKDIWPLLDYEEWTIQLIEGEAEIEGDILTIQNWSWDSSKYSGSLSSSHISDEIVIDEYTVRTEDYQGDVREETIKAELGPLPSEDTPYLILVDAPVDAALVNSAGDRITGEE